MEHDAARRMMALSMEVALSLEDERELALHLVGCEECKTLFDGLQHAHPALGALSRTYPPSPAVDAAVFRATTVLRGDADPGVASRAATAPALPDDEPSPPTDETIIPAGLDIQTGPMPDPDEPLEEEAPKTQVMRVDTSSLTPPPPPPLEIPPPPPPIPSRVEALPPLEPEPPLPEPEAFTLEPEPELVVGEPPAVIPIEVIADETEAIAPQRRDEVEELLDLERPVVPPPLPAHTEMLEMHTEDDLGPERPQRVGLWLAAIAATIALTVLVGVLVVRGPGFFTGGGGGLPSVDEVRDGVTSAFDEMKSLKANFKIQRLNLYRIGAEENSLRYAFAMGTYDGRIVYDKAEGSHRQEFTLQVRDREVTRAQVVQKPDETRTLLGSGADASLLVEKNPPLGLPDGASRPTIGLLEDAIGSVARQLENATDLEVVGREKSPDGRDTFRVSFSVEPDGVTRADKIDVDLDSRSWVPVVVRRSIARQNARVLAPESALDNNALDSAFGTNERVPTEVVELRNVSVDELVLPGELVIDVPSGVQATNSDGKFERLRRGQVEEKFGAKPLLPQGQSDLEERTLAVLAGDAPKWGPGDAYPAPAGVFQATYFDGRTTVTIAEKRMTATFNLGDTSPLQRAGVSIDVTPVTRAEKTFFFGVGPETVPHAYGFLGNTFVMVTGYLPQDELVRIVSSLAQAPEVAEPLATPTPTGSPGTSPAATAASTPAATPAASLPAATAAATP